MLMKKVLTIVGAGPGISRAVAKRFGHEGFVVVLIARDVNKLEGLRNELRAEDIDAYYFQGDAADAQVMETVLKRVEDQLGRTDVLLYNAAKSKAKGILDETAESLTEDFKTNVAGALTAVKSVIPKMISGESAVLITGGGLSINPYYQYGSLAIGKAGIRNLAASLYQALQPKGIFVGTITIESYVSDENQKYNPTAIADLFWKMYKEKKEFEIVY